MRTNPNLNLNKLSLSLTALATVNRHQTSSIENPRASITFICPPKLPIPTSPKTLLITLLTPNWPPICISHTHNSLSCPPRSYISPPQQQTSHARMRQAPYIHPAPTNHYRCTALGYICNRVACYILQLGTRNRPYKSVAVACMYACVCSSTLPPSRRSHVGYGGA